MPGDGEVLLVLLLQDIEGALELALADITPGQMTSEITSIRPAGAILSMGKVLSVDKV